MGTVFNFTGDSKSCIQMTRPIALTDISPDSTIIFDTYNDINNWSTTTSVNMQHELGTRPNHQEFNTEKISGRPIHGQLSENTEVNESLEHRLEIDHRDIITPAEYASGSNIGSDHIPDTKLQRIRNRLSELEHLNVLGHVRKDPRAGMIAYGGSCEIYRGVISRRHLNPEITFEHSRREIKVAIKMLRVGLQDEEKSTKVN